MHPTAKTGNAAGTRDRAVCAEPTFSKRIGSTTFVVAVHFSETNKERVEDKILRLIEREVGDVA